MCRIQWEPQIVQAVSANFNPTVFANISLTEFANFSPTIFANFAMAAIAKLSFAKMATPREKFIASLKFLKAIQDDGNVTIHTEKIPKRMYREILLKNGFIKEVTKGWYISTDPSEKEGETTSWFSAYWEFCAKFLEHKYGVDW